MTTFTFDTHAAVKKLIAAGMPDEQAEAQVEVLSEVLAANLGELATKQDLKELEMRLDARFDTLRGEFDARFADLRGDFGPRFEALRGCEIFLSGTRDGHTGDFPRGSGRRSGIFPSRPR
jgi:hypothetical protein